MVFAQPPLQVGSQSAPCTLLVALPPAAGLLGWQVGLCAYIDSPLTLGLPEMMENVHFPPKYMKLTHYVP